MGKRPRRTLDGVGFRETRVAAGATAGEPMPSDRIQLSGSPLPRMPVDPPKSAESLTAPFVFENVLAANKIFVV
jgi:hypothetical protein